MTGYITSTRPSGAVDVLWPSGRIEATFYGATAQAAAQKWCDILNHPKESPDAPDIRSVQPAA